VRNAHIMQNPTDASVRHASVVATEELKTSEARPQRSRRIDSYSDCNIKAPTFPIFVMSTAEIMRLPSMISFEEAVKKNLIREYHPDLGRLFFWSHQWLSAAHPDPDNVQFNTLQKTIRHLLTEDGIAHAFGTINASSHTRAFNMLGFSPLEMTKSVESGWHWLDYYSIPQSASHQGQVNREAAIASIPAYAQAAWLFLALTPPAIHHEAFANQSDKCNFETWCGRGWCRLERISCMWVREKPNALLCSDADNLEVMPPTNQIVADDSVCNGMFSCCGYNHTRLLAGKRRCGGCMRPHYQAVETRCDKVALLPVMRDIYAEHLRRVLRDHGHGVRFRLALALRAPFFAGSDELKDETVASNTCEGFIEDFEFEGPNDRDEFENTPLHWAAFIGSETACKGLIAKGCDVDAKSRIVDYEDSVREFYFIAGGGATAIHTGIMRQSMSCVEILIDNKADVNAQTVDGRSALWMAASRKMHDPMRYLISKSADVDVRTNAKGDFLNCADNTSALLISCFVGDVVGARMLIDAHADVNAQSVTGATPLLNSLMRATSAVALELVELLVDKKADLYARFAVEQPSHAAMMSGLDCIDVATKVRKGAIDDVVTRLNELRQGSPAKGTNGRAEPVADGMAER